MTKKNEGRLFEDSLFNNDYATIYYSEENERWEAELYDGSTRYSMCKFALEDRLSDLYAKDNIYREDVKAREEAKKEAEQAKPFEPFKVVIFHALTPFVATVISPVPNRNGYLVNWEDSPLAPPREVTAIEPRKKSTSHRTEARYSEGDMYPYREEYLPELKKLLDLRLEKLMKRKTAQDEVKDFTVRANMKIKNELKTLLKIAQEAK